VVVTANHYLLDAVGGAVTLGLGYFVGRALTRAGERRRARLPVLATSPSTGDAMPGSTE
jgi:hypothetical protein